MIPSLTLPAGLSPDEGALVTFNSGLSDAAGDVITIEWYVDNVLVPTATGPIYAKAWPDDGVHSVKVRAHDDDDPTWVEQSTLVTVFNVAPQNVDFVPPVRAIEGTPITLNGTFLDVGTDDTQTFLWSVTGPGSVVVATGKSQSLMFTPTDNGSYTATFTVTDDDLGTANMMTIFSITNAPPQDVVISGPTAVDEEVPANFAVTFNDPGTADTHTIAWAVPGRCRQHRRGHWQWVELHVHAEFQRVVHSHRHGHR